MRIASPSYCLSALGCLVTAAVVIVTPNRPAVADGKVVPPRSYQGSLEERAQEAIIIFNGSKTPGRATEELILKIEVAGDAREFAWVVPFPNEPEIAKEDPRLFRELFDYVEARQRRRVPTASKNEAGSDSKSRDDEQVTVLKRKVVGEYEITVVRENRSGGLNPWLEKNGYQKLEDAEDVLGFYRNKNYVFACIKVASAALESERTIESHPLRFSFPTGGRDGIYFPMKMTGLQSEPFDVNLYVFYRYWINDKLSRFGYAHRGFTLRHRDWDTPKCEPDGGKAYSLPGEDPFLSGMAHRIPTVTKLFQKLRPGEKYYLTSIQARQLKPDDVRAWSDDLWLFPYYTAKGFVPYDARSGGPAATAYPDADRQSSSGDDAGTRGTFALVASAVGVIACLLVLGVLVVRHLRRRAEIRQAWDKYDYGDMPKKQA